MSNRDIGVWSLVVTGSAQLPEFVLQFPVRWLEVYIFLMADTRSACSGHGLIHGSCMQWSWFNTWFLYAVVMV